jgi:altronate hydrolase
MDINCGAIVDGSETVERLGERIFRADARPPRRAGKTKSELHGYGQNEFVPWQLGAVM